ncbi:hypothetical protein V9T40_010138 [Parthenolecanium corni]|uniref:Huntingtin n=1 Tax=Parthenolecanium corni TaxID=536013 RepID=A0AAN9T2E5_9HEMI
MRLSTIFSDVVTDVTVKSSVTLNSSHPLLHPIPTDQPLLILYQSQLIDTSNTEKSEHFTKTGVDNKAVPFGQYNREPRYLKLKVSLKSAYNNYQVTLKPESSEKFISFLDTFLNSFATVLDFITVSEVDRICKEFLRHLRNFMIFLPVSSVHCVVQLFKCVFGYNRISDQLSYNDAEIYQNCSTDLPEGGYYDFCFQQPYNNLTTFLEIKQQQESETRKDWELPQSPSRSMVSKQRPRFSMNSFPSYIKLFEPNVIQSLKQYTVASDTALQAKVLNLLSQLIQLKVNYCLLDSEQVFIKFLLSQFQLIEDEQLQVVDKLLPAMFDFLIQLANEKHSKPIMSVPKVIQLCDSLTASIQSVCHCILAIEPVVKHVFTKFTAIANSEEIKELETQRDVLFSILLRLIHNPKSLPLLTIVLNNSVEELKLQRSVQITQILFATLVEGHMPADEESRSYFLELLFALHPASFDDQILLCSMFDSYRCNKTKDLDSWFPFIPLLLLALLLNYDENTIISGLEKLREHHIFTEENTKDVKLEDPLCVNVAKSVNVSPETAFVQFLYRLLGLVFQRLERMKQLDNSSEKIVLLPELILIFNYIIKSGKFELIREKLIENYPYDEEHEWIFQDTRSCYFLSTIHPVIALQWYELQLHLRDRSGELRWCFGQSSIRFSSGRPSSNVCNIERLCIGNDAIQIGVFLLACECQDEFIDDEELLKAFLENYFSILISCLSEKPVQKLMTQIGKSKIASNVLIEIIRKMLDESMIEDNKLNDVLHLLDFVHEENFEDVLLLCCRSNFLNSSSFPVRERAFIVLSRLLNSIRNVALELFSIQIPDDNSNFVEDLESLRLTSINKEWFFKEVKKKCYDESERDYRQLAVLLGELPLQDLFSIMEDTYFRSQILPYAFDVGVCQSLERWKAMNDDSSSELSPLFIASRSTLHRFIKHVRSSLPQVHEVYCPVKRAQQKREIQYRQRIDSLFSNKPFFDRVQDIIPVVKEFIISIQKLKSVIFPESFQEVVDFAVLCSQIAHWQIKNYRRWSKIKVMNSIQCCSAVLKIKAALDLVSPAQIGSIISAVFSVTESYFNDVIQLPNNPIMENVSNADFYSVHHSSHEISTLIDYFITKVPIVSVNESTSLEFSLRELLLVLSRSDLIYNYVRIPLEIWKHVPESHVIMGNCLTLNTIPEHFLQDSDILRNFVSRLMFIGWNSRLQFEECWMLLLIAFNSIPEDESSEEEVEVLSQVNVVAVSAVTSILVQTTYHPQPGCKISPNILHVSRYNNFHLSQCRKKQRLAAVNLLLTSELRKNDESFDLLFDKVNVNLEKLNYTNVYSFNQISIEYLSLCCQKNLNETSDFQEKKLNQLYRERVEIFQKMGIDVNSCVYFLMDFYSRWLLNPYTHSVHVLLEVVHSMFIISDLFTEISQFTWLLESCIIMWQKYQKNDDTVCSYLIVMMCKAAAVFIPVDSETKKLVVKALRTGLSSKFGLVQSAAMHGLLYLLERIFKKNTLNNWNNLGCEFESEILSVSITFVLQNVNVDLLEIFEKETAECLISISFYLIENNAGGDNASLLIDRLLKLSVRACKLKLWDVNSTIMQGFYNLLLFDNKRMSDYNYELGQLAKEILSTVSCPPFVCVQCLQMLATCMYLSDEFEDRTNEEANESFDTEKLVARMEKISFFFKRIQIGTQSEVRFICTLLPQILIDLFPSSEILNKVILEFLSPSQRYPELMAQIVFKIFQHMIIQSELPLIQDWVLSLLNNSRNYPTEKAVFYFTCFFISACANPWLVAFFPMISLRHTEVKYDDKQLLYFSALQFYSQLTNESQRKAFVTTFRNIEKNNPSSPLADILKMIL